MDLQAKMHRELIRYLVARAIICPVTGEVLDMDTCVVFLDTDGDPCLVLSQGGYTALSTDRPDVLVLLCEQKSMTLDPATVKAA